MIITWPHWLMLGLLLPIIVGTIGPLVHLVARLASKQHRREA